MTPRKKTTDTESEETNNTIVLPWWQNPVNIVVMLITMALVAGMLGWSIGNNNVPPHNDVDVGFLKDMRVHHEQAIDMAYIFRELPDTNPALRTVAESIAIGQSQEVGRMIGLLQSFGEEEYRRREDASMLWMGMSAAPNQMPGYANDESIEKLAAASGQEADKIFVDLMVTHHEGGIEMADYVVESGENDTVKMMSKGMSTGQRDEILELENLLNR